MSSLIKIMLTLAAVFASTFLILSSMGWLTVEQIEAWFEAAQTISPIYVVGAVVVLLFADLLIAVPTLTIITLSGFFLGHTYGAAAAITGLMLAGLSGYGLSYCYGEKLASFIIKDKEKYDEAKALFERHGVIMILLSRAVPILPEVTACMAGMTRMPLLTFILVWAVNVVPYTLIATYAGSVSTLDNPKPAIFTAIGLTVFFWVGWLIFRKMQKGNQT